MQQLTVKQYTAEHIKSKHTRMYKILNYFGALEITCKNSVREKELQEFWEDGDTCTMQMNWFHPAVWITALFCILLGLISIIIGMLEGIHEGVKMFWEELFVEGLLKKRTIK